MGLHSASDGGGDPDEEKEERFCYPEAPGQGPTHTAEEPIKCLAACKDFQLQQITVTLERQMIYCWTRLFSWKQEVDCKELVLTWPPSPTNHRPV